jgi:hypothetical protein
MEIAIGADGFLSRYAESASVDTVERVQHPKDVVTLIRRAAAIAAVLTLLVGNVAICAGWQPTPEARMACCTSGMTCPMHATESRGIRSRRAFSQAQADSCCATTSTRTQPSTSTAAFVLMNASAFVASAPVAAPAVVPALHEWRALVPLPASPVPRHLLLSVLLV